MVTPLLGFFGKLPSRGDFVQSQLPTDFVSAWDSWLQHIIVCSQNGLGDSWLETYLAMPIWHFALSAGVCGKAPVCGVLLTSVDSAGRYFPVTLAVSFDADQSPGLPLLLADRFDVAFALEDLAMAALLPDARFEDFTAQVESFILPKKCRFLTSHETVDVALSLGQTLVQDGLLAKRANWSSASLWWARWGHETRLMIEDGLPNPNGFATMLLSNGDMTPSIRPEVDLSSPQPAAAPLAEPTVTPLPIMVEMPNS